MDTISQICKKLRATLIIVHIIGLFLFSETIQASPNASFTANQTSGCAPLNVQFTSTSTGAVSYFWDLGNLNTSTLANPSNLYVTPGNYTITLIVTDASGNTDTAVYVNYIHAIGNPHADFSSNSTSSCIGNNLFSFTNSSTGGFTYVWDFGDGTTSTLPNPTHHYNISGTFTVTLLATNSFGCQDVKIRNLYITVFPKPDATITAATTSSCDSNTIFSFNSLGPGIVSWFWTFGDGATSNQQNPSHAYSSAGTYSVSLIAVNGNGCIDTVDAPTIIHVGTTQWASFTATPDSGCAPLTVTFNNTNANVASCVWNFGDNTTSSALAPTHIYNIPGFYTVSLVVTTTDGCIDSVQYTNMIQAGLQPTVNFVNSNGTGCVPFNVQFGNTSSNFVNCEWSFGDGAVSTQTNPSHTYTTNGIYTVTLTCWGPTGCVKSRTRSSIINVSSGHALFIANPRSGCPPLTVNFTNGSYGNQLSYHWIFGDGATSNAQAPTHIYTTAGIFDVTLIVTDSLGCTDTLVKPAYITTVDLVAGYVAPPPTIGCAPLTTQFNDGTIGTTSWLWDFGDGTTSTLQNPSHTYTTPGIYTVSLTSTGAGGACTQVINNFSTFDVRGGYAGFIHFDSPCPPYVTTFTDTSLNAVSWLWNFGDGTTSTSQNPNHNYTDPGYYSVSLTITTADGCTYTTQQNNIYFAPFGANFYGINQGTTFPMDVDFFANSVGATGWLWNFGDSTTSTLQNPVHTYPVFGNYAVTLQITNDVCTLFYAPPPFNFGTPDTTPVATGDTTAIHVQHGCRPFTMSFSNVVAGSVQWYWDFGDGDTSALQFPIHTYDTTGVFTVTLTTHDSFGNISVLTMDSVINVDGPQAAFTFNTTLNCNTTTIQFTDASTGGVNSWLWDYYDGTTDTTQNTIHIYPDVLPNHIITFTVTDTMGCSSSISTSIFANPPSPVSANESEVCGQDTIYFSTTLLNSVSYLWNFGDSTTSTQVNPSHPFLAEGIYYATLTVTDSSGCTQTFGVFPGIHVSIPVVNFSTVGSRHGCNKLRVDFINLSSTDADAYFWDFGDGYTSTSQTPSHIYYAAGSFNVTLTIYRGNCVSTLPMPNYIVIDTAHADFNFITDGICVPITATFTDLSVNPVAWSWAFGNGTTSTIQNPTSSYSDSTGLIKLVITDIHGCKDSVELGPITPLSAHFTVDSDSGCAPFSVQFSSDTSLAQAWFWNFGDGFTSTSQSPLHLYQTPGNYSVTLIVTSDPIFHCSDTIVMPNLINALHIVTDFTTNDRSGCAPYLVNFTNNSVDANTYLWDFGDSTTSTNQNPSHIYNHPGIYTVTLISSSTHGCSDTLVRQQYIHVLGPVTNFTASAFSGCNPFNVTFTDLSQDALDWSWTFGDGYASTQQSPVHLFQDTGSFIVALVTHDTSGCSSYYQLPQPIVVHAVPVASFNTTDTLGCQPFTADFSNASLYSDSYYWDFGDGDSSSSTNPSHVYTVPGTYHVNLISLNQFGCSDTFLLPQPVIVHQTPQPAFTVDTSQGCSTLYVNFQNLSENLSEPTYLWDFGNGTTSTLANPPAQFPDPGFYNISLTVTNSSGCTNSVMYPAYIHVFDTLPPAITNILSVSVTSNTTVEIKWENNPAIDLGAYKLYRLNPLTGVYENIYTIYNPNNTVFTLDPSYVDSGLNTLHQTYTYKLQTLDVCGYTIGLDELTAHTTINVTSQRVGNSIQVWWNSYGGCPVNTYQIYRSYPGSTPVLLATVPSTQMHYLDSIYECPYPYSYRITATDLCGRPYISNSDTSVTEPVNFLANQIVDVVRSTVVNNETVLTEWLSPVVHPEKVAQYDIYRSTDNINFSYLSSVPNVQTNYMDDDVNVQFYHYFYKIKVINTCSINEDPSLNTSTILLNGEMLEDRSVHLQWSPYEGWELGVDYYIIEKLDGSGEWHFLKQVDGTTTHYDYQE